MSGLLFQSIFWQTFVAVTLLTMDISAGFTELKQDYTKVTQDLEDMRNTLSIMTKEMTQMKRMSRALDALCSEWMSREDNFPEVDNSPEVTTEGTYPVHTVTEASKDFIQVPPINVKFVESRNDSTFTIEYEASSKAEVRTMYGAAVTQTFSSGRGVVHGNTSANLALAMMDNGKFVASVSVFMHVNASVNLPPINIAVDVQDDIVFQPGKSTQVKIRIAEHNISNYSLNYAMYAEDREAKDMVMLVRTDHQGIIYLSQTEEHQNYTEYTFTVNSEKQDYEGISFFDVSPRNTVGDPVFQFNVYFGLYVRRSDHQHSFPDGFMGFRFDVDLTKTVKSTESFGYSLFVGFVGWDLKNMTIWKLNHGREEEVEVDTEVIIFHKSVHDYIFSWSNTSRADAGRYLLKGSNTHGKVIYKEFDLEVVDLK